MSKIAPPPLDRPHDDLVYDEGAAALVEALCAGGDARITLNPDTGLNRYYSAPYPRSVTAYSSSTISDISLDAFSHLLALQEQTVPSDYRAMLEAVKQRIGTAYDIADSVEFAFAPSGTDLEYIALAVVFGRAEGGVHNVLLGADEIGSGCIHSAHGRYFAKETALGVAVEPAQPVPGCEQISLVDIAVRCGDGMARSSREICAAMCAEVQAAMAENKHSLVHIVHGSKTGLVLPELADLDALIKEFGGHATFVVDACQARITSQALAAYVERNCIVLLTGSKFIGAPPFSGMAILPKTLVQSAAALPEGYATIFNRAEFPQDWSGADHLPDGANPSLALRLEAAAFELDRFQRIPLAEVEAIIDGFERALEIAVIEPLGANRVLPHTEGREGRAQRRPIEMRTLVTLDVSMLPGLKTFDDAQAVHKAMALHGGLRLGQPVKCVRQGDGWGGTLRVGLSMPMIVAFAAMGVDRAIESMRQDLARITTWLTA